MARPHGSYRAARRNEARNARKGRSRASGKRVKHLSYVEVLKINAIAAHNKAQAEKTAAKADPIVSHGDFKPLYKEHELAAAS